MRFQVRQFQAADSGSYWAGRRCLRLVLWDIRDLTKGMLVPWRSHLAWRFSSRADVSLLAVELAVLSLLSMATCFLVLSKYV